MTSTSTTFTTKTATAVFATSTSGATFRVSDPLTYSRSLLKWSALEDLRRKGRFPHVRVFEVRTVFLGEDRPLVGPAVTSHDRYDGAPLDLLYATPVAGSTRGFKEEEQPARAAWRQFTGGTFHRRRGVGRERESDPAGDSTGVQGRGGWFYWPNGTTAAQGLGGLAQVTRRRRMTVQGGNGRWYVLQAESCATRLDLDASTEARS